MKSETHAYYDKYAEKWSATKTNSFYHERPFRMFEKLLKKGDRVLDIGCAYGIHVPLFLGIGQKLKYAGVDISESMIRIARSRYPQLTFARQDVLDLKPKRRFDAFWAAAILMHIHQADWPKMFDAINRNMRPGAIGYITLPSERPNPISEEDPRHFELFDKRRFFALAKKQGWKILKSGVLDKTNKAAWTWFIVELPR